MRKNKISLTIVCIVLLTALFATGIFSYQLFTLRDRVSFKYEGSAEITEEVSWILDDLSLWHENSVIVPVQYTITNNSMFELKFLKQTIDSDFLKENGIEPALVHESIVDGVLMLKKGRSYTYINFYAVDKDTPYQSIDMVNVITSLRFSVFGKECSIDPVN